MSRAFGYRILIVAVVSAAVSVLLLWQQGRARTQLQQARHDVEHMRLEAEMSADVVPEWILDEQTVYVLKPELLKDRRMRYDPVSVVRYVPHHDQTFPWPEHPKGEIRWVTNDLGFRDDDPVTGEKQRPRVLVAGDSHTFGMVANAECFTALLEGRLGGACEVLNAAVGGTGPYEYLGTLRKHLALEPDVFVAVLFTGNDFQGALRFADHFGGRTSAALPEDVGERLETANDTWEMEMRQGLEQAYLFKHRPGDVEPALAAAVEDFAAMKALCDERGVGFVAVVLPTKIDVDLFDQAQRLAKIAEALAMTIDDFAVNHRLGERFAQALGERGITVVDLHQQMLDDPRTLYWDFDHHLNAAGHAVVAEALEPIVGELLEFKEN